MCVYRLEFESWLWSLGKTSSRYAVPQAVWAYLQYEGEMIYIVYSLKSSLSTVSLSCLALVPLIHNPYRWHIPAMVIITEVTENE